MAFTIQFLNVKLDSLEVQLKMLSPFCFPALAAADGLLSTPLFGLKEPQMLSPLLSELGAEKRKRTRIGNAHEDEP